MLRFKSWFLLGLVSASCIVPDVEVVDSDQDDESRRTSGTSATSGGKASSAGTGAGAESGSPGEEGGSTGASPGPSGGSGPTPPPTPPVGKFCNDITVGGESITLTLSVGTGVKKVLFSAASGTCQPISGQACKLLPVGAQIPVTLLDGSTPIVTYPADIEDGTSWIFVAYTDGQNVDFVGNSVTQEACELGYDVPPAAE